MNKCLTILALIFFSLFFSGCVFDKAVDDNKVEIIKEDNMCREDSDCGYVWFTGGCFTPEYISKMQAENEKKGLFPGEAPPRENVTCTCEDYYCVTHG